MSLFKRQSPGGSPPVEGKPGGIGPVRTVPLPVGLAARRLGVIPGGDVIEWRAMQVAGGEDGPREGGFYIQLLFRDANGYDRKTVYVTHNECEEASARCHYV